MYPYLEPALALPIYGIKRTRASCKTSLLKIVILWIWGNVVKSLNIKKIVKPIIAMF